MQTALLQLSYWQDYQQQHPSRACKSATVLLNVLVMESIRQNRLEIIVPDTIKELTFLRDDRTYKNALYNLQRSGVLDIKAEKTNHLDDTIISLCNLCERYPQSYSETSTERSYDRCPEDAMAFPHTYTYARACAELVVISNVNKGNRDIELDRDTRRRIDKGDDENFQDSKKNTHPIQPVVSQTDRQPPIDKQREAVSETYATVGSQSFTEDAFRKKIAQLFSGENESKFRSQYQFSPLERIDSFLNVRQKPKVFRDDDHLYSDYKLWVCDPRNQSRSNAGNYSNGSAPQRNKHSEGWRHPKLIGDALPRYN